MHSVEFTRMLRSAHHDSGLTKAEIARWFGRNYWTVNRWINGSSPYQDRKQAEESLLLLTRAIREGRLPLASNLPQQARERALGMLLDAIKSNKRVSAPHLDRAV